MRVLVKALDEGPYVGCSVVVQDDRVQIVTFPPRLMEEIRRVREVIAKTQEELTSKRVRLEALRTRFEEERRRYLTLLGRLGAYTRALRFYERELARVRAITSLVREGREIAEPIYWWLRRRLRWVGIEAPIEAIKVFFIDYLRKYEEYVLDRIKYYSDTLRKVREEFRYARDTVVKLLMDIERVQDEIRKEEKEVRELSRTLTRLIAEAEREKVILVPDIEHLELELTVAIETGPTKREAIVAEIYFRTTIVGKENLLKLEEFEARLKNCSIRNTACFFYNHIASEPFIKGGIRYAWYEKPKTEAVFPYVEAYAEWAHFDRDTYEGLLRFIEREHKKKVVEVFTVDEVEPHSIRGKRTEGPDIILCEPPEWCAPERLLEGLPKRLRRLLTKGR